MARPLARSRALRRYPRLPPRLRPRHVEVARLGDPRPSTQPALTMNSSLADRRRPAAERDHRAEARDRFSAATHDQLRRRRDRRGVSRGLREGSRRNTFATAFLGLTLACCECHDHKFDPVTQSEFYQLYALLQRRAGARTRWSRRQCRAAARLRGQPTPANQSARRRRRCGTARDETAARNAALRDCGEAEPSDPRSKRPEVRRSRCAERLRAPNEALAARRVDQSARRPGARP